MNHPPCSSRKEYDREACGKNAGFRPGLLPLLRNRRRAGGQGRACVFRKPVTQLAKLAIEVACRIVAVRRILREQPLNDPSQRRGHGRGQRFRVFANDGRHDFGRAGALKDALARGELIQNQAERKLVRLGIEIRVSARLFRAHIGDRAHGGSGVGDARHERVSLAGHGLRQTEVENFDAPLAREQNVVGLQVAVDNACRVRGCQSIAQLHRNVEQFARGID